MTWFERDNLENNGNFKPVPAGTRRTFGSYFHSIGDQNFEVHFKDDETASVIVPDIFLQTTNGRVPLEREYFRESFGIVHQKRDGTEIVVYEARFAEVIDVEVTVRSLNQSNRIELC